LGFIVSRSSGQRLEDWAPKRPTDSHRRGPGLPVPLSLVHSAAGQENKQKGQDQQGGQAPIFSHGRPPFFFLMYHTGEARRPAIVFRPVGGAGPAPCCETLPTTAAGISFLLLPRPTGSPGRSWTSSRSGRIFPGNILPVTSPTELSAMLPTGNGSPSS